MQDILGTARDCPGQKNNKTKKQLCSHMTGLIWLLRIIGISFAMAKPLKAKDYGTVSGSGQSFGVRSSK